MGESSTVEESLFGRECSVMESLELVGRRLLYSTDLVTVS